MRDCGLNRAIKQFISRKKSLLLCVWNFYDCISTLRNVTKDSKVCWVETQFVAENTYKQICCILWMERKTWNLQSHNTQLQFGPIHWGSGNYSGLVNNKTCSFTLRLFIKYPVNLRVLLLIKLLIISVFYKFNNISWVLSRYWIDIIWSSRCRWQHWLFPYVNQTVYFCGRMLNLPLLE